MKTVMLQGSKMSVIKLPQLTLLRFSAPNQYDHAEQGTECIVTEGIKKILYIQKCPDETNPCWILMGPYEGPDPV